VNFFENTNKHFGKCSLFILTFREENYLSWPLKNQLLTIFLNQCPFKQEELDNFHWHDGDQDPKKDRISADTVTLHGTRALRWEQDFLIRPILAWTLMNVYLVNELKPLYICPFWLYRTKIFIFKSSILKFRRAARFEDSLVPFIKCTFSMATFMNLYKNK